MDYKKLTKILPVAVFVTGITTLHACHPGSQPPSTYRNAKSFYGSAKSTHNHLGLFDILHSKFVELGQGYHGPPVYHFEYHMEEARWIHIQPMTLGKVVVSNTCPQFFHEKNRCPQQGKKIGVDESTMATRSWTENKGLTKNKNLGLNFNAGVPFLKIDLQGTKSWGITKSKGHALGKVETKVKNFKIGDMCVAGAGQIVTCKFCAIKIQIEVPFTIWRTDGEEIHGHFYGNDYIYGGLSVTYQNLWPSNSSIVEADNILC